MYVSIEYNSNEQNPLFKLLCSNVKLRRTVLAAIFSATNVAKPKEIDTRNMPFVHGRFLTKCCCDRTLRYMQGAKKRYTPAGKQVDMKT